MSTTLALTDEKIFNGLSAFAKKHLGGPDRVITVHGFVGRVSQVKGRDYVLITVMTSAPTSTATHAYNAEEGTITVTAPTRKGVQLDCFGGKAETWAKTLAALLADEIGTAFLQDYGFAPLYVGSALNMTQLDGRGGFADRWMIECTVHRQEQVTTDQDFFDGVTLAIRTVQPV